MTHLYHSDIINHMNSSYIAIPLLTVMSYTTKKKKRSFSKRINGPLQMLHHAILIEDLFGEAISGCSIFEPRKLWKNLGLQRWTTLKNMLILWFHTWKILIFSIFVTDEKMIYNKFGVLFKE